MALSPLLSFLRPYHQVLEAPPPRSQTHLKFSGVSQRGAGQKCEPSAQGQLGPPTHKRSGCSSPGWGTGGSRVGLKGWEARKGYVCSLPSLKGAVNLAHKGRVARWALPVLRFPQPLGPGGCPLWGPLTPSRALPATGAAPPLPPPPRPPPPRPLPPPPPHLYSWIEPQKGLEKAWPQSFGCSFFFLTLLQEFPFYLETFP